MANVFKRLLGLPEPSSYEFGSVAYHKHQAREERITRRWVYFTPAIAGFLALVGDNNDPFGRGLMCVYLLLMFFAGTRWIIHTNRIAFHKQKAWEVETETTIHAMMLSGMFDSPLDVLTTMRDGPPPPGWKKDEWVRAGNKALEDARKQLEDGGWPGL